ncbi:Phage tail assembly chaperone protein [uncultured Caudovirales phage]|uniref:Phage tail assembly chaperone protein n=1 Tax=uncultured Caudovirales phage TaxID=2100421 RepID=A0A6J5MFE9_9CAUD|nr:Phage tail assembly chaperone protein [uncultured Caudovirales phage]
MAFNVNPEFPNATDEQKWEQFRLWRSVELRNTDYTQLDDAPGDKAAWATYRQALRDLPAQGGKIEDAEFPNEPNKL